MPDTATALPLLYWQDPQSPLALAVAPATCDVFFALWDEDGIESTNQLGKITFTECWATRTFASEYLPYAIGKHGFRSFLLTVANSTWLAATVQQRLAAYPTWQSWDTRTYYHYVVQGAGSYLEVLATSFVAGVASPEECQRYAFLQG